MRKLVSAGFVGRAGQLALRPAARPADAPPVPLTGEKNEFLYPLALAAVGDATAVILLKSPPPAGTTGRTDELRLVAADGTAKTRVPLKGVSTGGMPVIAASADAKWVAVAGFADDRIEVYDAAALAADPPAPQVLDGAPAGFARVAFLDGNKLWLGGAGTDAPRGDTVLDLATRAATPAAAALVPDVAPLNPRYDRDKDEWTLAVGGQDRKVTLREYEVPTAAALLPAAPAWDKTLGPVLAVAHYHKTALVSLVTLFDATDGRRLLQLGGPTLRVNGLAFSGSRPLLAAVGADRTVAVWSLKALAAPFAAVEGITLVERDGKLAVASVAPTSPARDVLKPGA